MGALVRFVCVGYFKRRLQFNKKGLREFVEFKYGRFDDFLT